MFRLYNCHEVQNGVNEVPAHGFLHNIKIAIFLCFKKCKTQNCIAELSSLKCLNYFLKANEPSICGLFSDMFESLKGVNLATKIWEVSSENSTPIYIFLILAEKQLGNSVSTLFSKKTQNAILF